MGVELREVHDPRSDGREPEPVEAAVRPRSFHGRDAGVLAGAALSSFSLMYLVFFRLSPLSGLIGFLLAWYVTFLCIYGLVVRELEGRRFARDKVMTVIIGTAGFLVVAPLFAIAAYVLIKGLKGLTWAFFTKDASLRRAERPLRPGRRDARHRRHADAGRTRDRDLGAAGPDVRRVPQRDRRSAAPARPHLRRRDERRAHDHRRPVHLLDVAPGHWATRWSGFAAAMAHLDLDAAGRSPAPPRRCCGSCPTVCARPRSPSAPPSGAPCGASSCQRPARASSPP